MSNRDIMRLCRISKASFHRYLQAYVTGGIEKLKDIDHDRPQRELVHHRPTIEAYFREHPPATVAEAAANIKELTGIERTPTQGRHFLKFLGLNPINVGMIPAKAEVDAQEALKKTVWSLGEKKPKQANDWSSSGMPPMLSLHHFGGFSGVFSGCL